MAARRHWQIRAVIMQLFINFWIGRVGGQRGRDQLNIWQSPRVGCSTGPAGCDTIPEEGRAEKGKLGLATAWSAVIGQWPRLRYRQSTIDSGGEVLLVEPKIPRRQTLPPRARADCPVKHADIQLYYAVPTLSFLAASAAFFSARLLLNVAGLKASPLSMSS